MIQKTKNYEMFVFRDDNREDINQAHVRALVESIRSLNLLELTPILVNEKMEVINGQHRLLAAKELGVDIYYHVQEGLGADELLVMNTNLNWRANDFLNFWCKKGNQDYIKLRDFVKKHNIDLRVGLTLCVGNGKNTYKDFKDGKFTFKEFGLDNEIEQCWDTVNFIKKMNGFSNYTRSGKFWQALIKLVTHHNFNAEKWKANLAKMIERLGPRTSTKDYCILLMDIYNWRNKDNKCDILEA